MDKLRKLRIYNEVKSDVNGKYYVRVNEKIDAYFQITRTRLNNNKIHVRKSKNV